MNKLDLLVILDRSGSMQDAKSDHEGGLRSFIEDQKKIEGDVRLTLVQFDHVDPCEIVYDRTPLADVKDIVLVPRGSTPLLDAVGRAVSHLRGKLTDGDPVVAMVITDGEENQSTEWTRERVKSLVTEMEGKGWNFLFLGANVDAFTEASSIGIPMAGAISYSVSGQGINNMYAATSSNLLRGRKLANSGADAAAVSASLSYSDDQRTSAKE